MAHTRTSRQATVERADAISTDTRSSTNSLTSKRIKRHDRDTASPQNCLSAFSAGVRKHKKHLRKTHPKVLGPVNPADTSVQTSPLFRLPGEIRNMIWQYVLTSPTEMLRYDEGTRRFYASNPDPTIVDEQYDASLIHTCHQICIETLYMPLKFNTILFPNLRTWENLERKIDRLQRVSGHRIHVKDKRLVSL